MPHTRTHLHTLGPFVPLHREKCGKAYGRLQRTAAAGCGFGTRMRRKDAVPDASQPQPGRSGGGAEPQTEAAVARETQAGGGVPAPAARLHPLPLVPPSELRRGPKASHPLTHSSRRGTHLASGARFLRPGLSEALGQDLSGRADFPSCPLGRLGRGPLGSAPAHPEEGLLVFRSVSSWPVTFPWVSPSFSHCAPAQCPAWRRCSVGAQGVSE